MTTESKSMLAKVLRAQAESYGCDVGDFTGDKNVIVEAPTDQPFLRMIGFGAGTVVSAHPSFVGWCRTALSEINGTHVFDAPTIVEIGSALKEFGCTLGEIFDCFLPSAQVPKADKPEGFDVSFVEGDAVTELYAHPGFENSLTYHPDHTGIVVVASRDGIPCGISGANPMPPGLWAIGVDVLQTHRERGIATYLVSELTQELLSRDLIPVYPTWYSNIHSRNTALRVGYRPAWVEITAIPVRKPKS